MGSGASAFANMNRLTFEVSSEFGSAISEVSSDSEFEWTKLELAGAIEGVLNDDQRHWNVGNNSYKNLFGDPTFDACGVVFGFRRR